MIPSLSELLAELEAPGAERTAELLALARELARSSYEHRCLLASARKQPALSPSTLEELAQGSLRAAAEEHDVWAFRDVADYYLSARGDREAASLALQRCAKIFAEAPAETSYTQPFVLPVQGYQWVLLAQGFRAQLGDEARARQCLERGLVSARSTGDAAAMLDLSVALKQPEVAREAERVGANGTLRVWTLANAYWSLDLPEEAERALDTALSRARSFAVALEVARAWLAHGAKKRAKKAAARAERLAASAEELLDLAQYHFDNDGPSKRVRALLQSAAGRAQSSATKERVAGLLHSWVGDAAASKRAGPRGAHPAELRAAGQPLPGWERSAEGLFDWLRARVTREQLEEVAQADYGHEAAAHLAALADFCESGLLPRSLAWEPHEVLALTRWSEGPTTDHLTRALSTVILCLTPGDMDELATDGVILLDSCLALGPEALAHAERFFAWLASTQTSSWTAPQERCAALLLLLVARSSASPEDPRLDALCEALLAALPSAEDFASSLGDSLRARLWTGLLKDHLGPRRAAHALTARVLEALGR